MKSLSQLLEGQLFVSGDESAWIFTVVKPGFLQYTAKIIKMFEDRGWEVSQITSKQLLLKQAKELYAVHKKEDFYDDLCDYMSSGVSTAIIYRKPGRVSKEMFDEVGELKDKIRKKWGESDMRNVMHSSDSLSAMEKESAVYF